MQAKAKAVFGPLAALGIAAAFIWPGCAPLPIGSQRMSFADRKPQDFEFAKSSRSTPQLTRTDVINKVGHPDAYFPDMRVACYQVDSLIRRRLLLFLFVLPISVEHYPDGVEVAYIQFDEHDNVMRAGVVKESFGFRRDMESDARNWVTKADRSKR